MILVASYAAMPPKTAAIAGSLESSNRIISLVKFSSLTSTSNY